MKNLAILLCITLFGGYSTFAQFQTDSIISLKSPITESSGLLFVNGIFITHNDSGNPPLLYEIDTATGLPSRTVYISNATNIDWEDLTADDDYIYIGDFGNNQGTRQNLRIYKVALTDYWASDTVVADTINFSYADQTSFTPAPFQTNYDAEAMVTMGDSLWVFTKRWTKGGSAIYKLPKTTGTYAVSPTDSIPDAYGLVTAADCFVMFGSFCMLAIVENTVANPRLLIYYVGIGDKLTNSPLAQDGFFYPYGSKQVEGAAWTQPGILGVSSEALGAYRAMLHVVQVPLSIDEAKDEQFKVYPNPSLEKITIDFQKMSSGKLSILNPLGTTLHTFEFNDADHIDIDLPRNAGLYLLEVVFKYGTRSVQRVVKR